VLLGEIDGVEVDAELGEPEEGCGEQALAAKTQALAFPQREHRHPRCRDDEAVGHRPLRWHDAELRADDDPGRSPDRCEDDEWNGDRPQPIPARVMAAVNGLSEVARSHE